MGDYKLADAEERFAEIICADTTAFSFLKIPLSQSFFRTVYVVDFFQFISFSQIFTSSGEPSGSLSHMISANLSSASASL